MTTTDKLIRTLTTMKKDAESCNMVYLVDVLENDIERLQSGRSVPNTKEQE